MARTDFGLPGIYNATPITLTDGVGAALALDASGNIKVAPASGSFGAADQSTFVPASTTGSISMGVYETSPETLANNQAAAVGVDVNRNVKVREQYAPGYEDNVANVAKVEERFTNAYISTTTTTTVKSGAGFLHAITVGTTAAGAITIYDNTAGSGTIIGVLKSSVSEQTFFFDVSFSTGLTIVTAASSLISIAYR